MMDRRLVVSICAGLLALAAGVVAAILGVPALALIAGIAGLTGAVAAAGISARARTAEEQLHEMGVDRARLRRELDALAAIFAEEATRRRAQDDAEVTVPRVDRVIDPVTGLLDDSLFEVLVQQRVAAARRQLQPVSVVIFHLDGVEHEPDDVRDQAMAILGDVILRTLRECDTTCRLDDTLAAAVLEDTAEAGAVWAAERVRGTLHGSPVGDSLTISAGIACYPSHALSASELLEMANRALETARSRGRDHVEIAQID